MKENHILKLDNNAVKGIRLFKRRKAKVMELQDVIDFCDSFLGYDCTLILAAVIENVEYYCENDDITKLLKRLSKRMRYGLVTQTSIILYEMGFNNRICSNKGCRYIGWGYVAGKSRKEIVNLIKRDSNIRRKIEGVLQNYPTYFSFKFEEIVYESKNMIL